MGNEQSSKEGTLSFNRASGLYEGTIRIGIDAELYRRKLFREMEENESADLSDPMVLATIIAQVSKTSAWLNHPHTRIIQDPLPTPKPLPDAPMSEKREVRASLSAGQPWSNTETKRKSIREELRERARYIAPHLWDDECITPYGDTPFGGKERGRLGARRHDERAMLQKLREEWEAGTFILDAGAAEEEERYQKEQREKLGQKLEVMAVAVNSNGFH